MESTSSNTGLLSKISFKQIIQLRGTTHTGSPFVRVFERKGQSVVNRRYFYTWISFWTPRSEWLCLNRFGRLLIFDEPIIVSSVCVPYNIVEDYQSLELRLKFFEHIFCQRIVFEAAQPIGRVIEALNKCLKWTHLSFKANKCLTNDRKIIYNSLLGVNLFYENVGQLLGTFRLHSFWSQIWPYLWPSNWKYRTIGGPPVHTFVN